MKNLNRPGPWTAFQPPSDMTGDGGGSSKSKKIFIGLGIGCGAILLIVGILSAAGAFKALTCCDQVKGIAEKSMGAERFGDQFAQNIYEGNLDEAYAATSEEFQQKMSRDAFGAAVEAHRDRIAKRTPRIFNMQLEQHGSQAPSLDEMEKGSWLMSYQFAGSTDETMLLLNVRVSTVGEGDETKFVASDVEFDERPRNLRFEPPAEEVLQVHDMLQRGQYEIAYGRLGDPFKTETNRETWRQFLKDVGPILTQSRLEIREITYNEANTRATVIAHAESRAGVNGIIQFELVPMQKDLPGFGWRIVTIAPLVAETPTDENEAVPATGGTNGATGANPTTNGAGAGATAGAVAEPEVEAKADFD